MPAQNERNLFRRLIGDFGVNNVADADVDAALADATYELTSMSGAVPTTWTFDTISTQYHPEIVYKAAINWWWQYATSEGEKFSVSMGAASSNQGERFQKAMSIIEGLQAHYDQIKFLGVEMTNGDYSRFSKKTLSRLGGQPEEAALSALT